MQDIRVAIIDLYNNEPNEGMRGIQSLLDNHPTPSGLAINWKRFDLRFKNEIPDTSFDIYICSGGPGSPLEEPGAVWEKRFFALMDELMQMNANDSSRKKFVFFICHSFQLMCRHLGVGEISKRKSTAFGIFPVHLLEGGKSEYCFQQLPDPFHVVDSRDWQVTQPNQQQIEKLGLKLLALEKERPYVPFERALMGVRFTPEMIGTQFHPEADPKGMLHYLLRADKKEIIVRHHGQEKYDDMLEHLNDPDKILLTQQSILPSFLNQAIHTIWQEVLA